MANDEHMTYEQQHSDQDIDSKFASIKARVENKLLGSKRLETNDPDAIEFRDVDKNWNAGKSWMSQLRYTNPMNNDTEGVGAYNELIHKNNGVVVTKMNAKPGFDAPFIK